MDTSTPRSQADELTSPPSDVRERLAGHLWAGGVFVATVLMSVLMFPPARMPEFAYLFAAPAVFWAYRSPRWKAYAWSLLGASAVSWTILLGWLHHVTWLGLFLLGPIVGLWVGSWFLAVRWAMPRLSGRGHLVRIGGMLGLAGLWVVIEWTRQWLLGGFPWLPLAASQWQRVTILQIAAYTGSGGVSFVLVMMNLGFAAYAHRLLDEGRDLLDAQGAPLARGLRIGFARRSQEFMLAIFLLLLCISLQLQEALGRGRFSRPAGTFAIVQPDIPQTLKWDPEEGPWILRILRDETLKTAAAHPDAILWPEATTPWAAIGDPDMNAWMEALAARATVPIVFGSIVLLDQGGPGEQWYNGVLAADPTSGVRPKFYAKRKLVPFGEFVPMRPLLGWLDKVVPVGGDFDRGRRPVLLTVNGTAGALQLGPLICYEDIFEWPAADSVRAGADALIVNTNGAWFGRGGAAEQHAANSVLRAVETRRPVLRAGNAGWSGWIDEFGSVRAVLTQQPDGTISTDPALADKGTLYFRGSASVSLSVDTRWVGRESFYVRHGNWFVLCCAGFVAIGFWGVRGSAYRS